MDLHGDIMESLMGVSSNNNWKKQVTNPNVKRQHTLSQQDQAEQQRAEAQVRALQQELGNDSDKFDYQADKGGKMNKTEGLNKYDREQDELDELL